MLHIYYHYMSFEYVIAFDLWFEFIGSEKRQRKTIFNKNKIIENLNLLRHSAWIWIPGT